MASFLALLAASSILCLCIISSIEALNRSFTVELIHHDSPKSPFFNPTEPSSLRVGNALRRAIKRANHFNLAAAKYPSAVESDVTVNEGEYLMRYSVGTPPFQVLGIADTGSDLVWLQCSPCTKCYNQIDPLFDPSKSKTYANVPCDSPQCQNLEESSCSSNDQNPTCQYSINYGDHSFSHGNLALETLTLESTSGNPISFPRTVIGCGHSNDGTFNDKGSGIVGLGSGSVSLVSQLGSSIGGKFSYCLVPIFTNSNISSKLSFGDNAIVSGPGTVSTPIVPRDTDTFYYLTLEAISVGENRIEFGGLSNEGAAKGNIVIDSGTTVTILPDEFYSRLESAVGNLVQLERVEDPQEFLSLCYRAKLEEMEIPIITAHFMGADIKLTAVNSFIEVTEEVTCFAFRSIQNGAVFGNLAQVNFHVGYDLEKKTVSFKPEDCTKL
ncbi:hypothetical protein L6164_017226 [Bauhinia variegata]|uniref:Uncharacterized protein n=1 Tax=Bauhinia variegata TaxID=167791 RepID=A0ACB9N932_BAUVA|nr:hypothetical protein L6164_017226 [Bauhinia variegata]